jgi:hypothetical protein
MKNALNSKLNINVRAIRWVQRMIKKYPDAYDQESFGDESRGKYVGTHQKPFLFNPQKMDKPECGSACCVAGWGYLYATKEPPGLATIQTIEKVAQKAFGLTSEQAICLFAGRDATPEQGIANLERLIETRGREIWGEDLVELFGAE